MPNKILCVFCVLACLQVPVCSQFSFVWQEKRPPTMDDVFQQLAQELRKNGSMRYGSGDVKHVEQMDTGAFPEVFDSRENWPECADVIERVRHQGTCASSWAVQAASVMSDRLCITSNGTTKVDISAEDIVSCCGDDCLVYANIPCMRGITHKALHYLLTQGAVTETCRPTPITYRDRIECNKTCRDEYNQTYENDKHRANAWRLLQPIRNMTLIQEEIYNNGPVHAHMRVFEDFRWYINDIYRYTRGPMVFTQHVKIIGWGTEEVGNKTVKYWLCVNSWGDKWGELKGLFKIQRGINTCGIESEVYSISVPRPRTARTMYWRGLPTPEKSHAGKSSPVNLACLVLILSVSLEL